MKETREHLTADRLGIEKKLLEPANAQMLGTAISDMLNIVKTELAKHADDLEEATGMCSRVASIRLTSYLMDALEEQLAWDTGFALHEGDSRQTVAKAMNKDPANISRSTTKLGRDIITIRKAYEYFDGHEPDEPGYYAVSVRLENSSRILKVFHPEAKNLPPESLQRAQTAYEEAYEKNEETMFEAKPSGISFRLAKASADAAKGDDD